MYLDPNLSSCRTCDEGTQMNRREAIAEVCRSCGESVRNCDRPSCHLYPFRLPSKKQDPKERSKAIRKMCLWCMGSTKYSPEHVRTCDNPGCPLFPYRLSG